MSAFAIAIEKALVSLQIITTASLDLFNVFSCNSELFFITSKIHFSHPPPPKNLVQSRCSSTHCTEIK